MRTRRSNDSSGPLNHLPGTAPGCRGAFVQGFAVPCLRDKQKHLPAAKQACPSGPQLVSVIRCQPIKTTRAGSVVVLPNLKERLSVECWRRQMIHHGEQAKRYLATRCTPLPPNSVFMVEYLI